MNQRQANRLATLRWHIRGKYLKKDLFDVGKYLYGYFTDCYPKFDGSCSDFLQFLGIDERQYNQLFIYISRSRDAQSYIKKILRESGWSV